MVKREVKIVEVSERFYDAKSEDRGRVQQVKRCKLPLEAVSEVQLKSITYKDILINGPIITRFVQAMKLGILILI